MNKVSNLINYQPPIVSLSSLFPQERLNKAVLVIGVVNTNFGPKVCLLNPSLLNSKAIADIESILTKMNGDGSEEQTHQFVVDSLSVASVFTIGLGKMRLNWPSELIRHIAGTAARELNNTPILLTALADINLQAAIEGAILGAYQFNYFKSSKTISNKSNTKEIIALTSNFAFNTSASVDKSVNIATAVATARDLVNTPPNYLYPKTFAKQAKVLGDNFGLLVEVLDEKALENGGYGGIIGVGKGSENRPYLVRLVYLGGGKESSIVALVGKGITFDTGGISIKPSTNMHHMTSDMAGAASVIASIILAAKQRLPINLTATIPMAENMLSSTAQRPGDVLKQYGGTTVEILNTDAEGRLILADAIVRACEDSPKYLIETSTLTGAQSIALGSRTPGIMGSDEFRNRVALLSQKVGENAWPMPLPSELEDELKSPIADLVNVSESRYAGMLLAGKYLCKFIPNDVQWVHIDVATPAYNIGNPWGYTPKGGTGVPTRTIFAVLEDISKNG